MHVSEAIIAMMLNPGQKMHNPPNKILGGRYLYWDAHTSTFRYDTGKLALINDNSSPFRSRANGWEKFSVIPIKIGAKYASNLLAVEFTLIREMCSGDYRFLKNDYTMYSDKYSKDDDLREYFERNCFRIVE